MTEQASLLNALDYHTVLSQAEELLKLKKTDQILDFNSWQIYEFKETAGSPSSEKQLIKTVFFNNDTTEAKLNKTEQKTELSVVSPFFDLEKSVDLYRKLVDIYGERKGTDLARKIFIKDVESQLWELRESPSSFRYRMHMINGRLVHESDLHDGTPLLNGVTDKIRRGKEKEQMVMLEQTVKDLPIGSTILIPSPKLYERDEKKDECPYSDSILTRITKIDENTFEGLQTMSKLEAPEIAKLINKLSGKTIIDPEAHIDTILLSLVKVNQTISDLEVIKAMEEITGTKILTKSPEQYAEEEMRFGQLAKNGGTQLLDWIKNGIIGKDLVQKYTTMMAESLKGVKSSKVHDDGMGGVFFDTSCGSFGNMGLMRKGIIGNENGSEKKMWCTNEVCKKENVCIGEKKMCNFCGSKLSDKKP